ncbi:MAG: PEP-CTERM sorting domain-containing protein [Planctomycetes bacterium]|nr:PEP-CTERM sorting domain-containing protein [Planctomycetota bacterium]
MRRATALVVVVGVVVLGTAGPARAAEADGFWLSVASGISGSSDPANYQEWWFETPHGPPSVAVTRLTGGTAEATTAGGSTFFSGPAVPVNLKPTDGYAYLAGNKPSDLSAALRRQMAGGKGLATTAPDAFATMPADGAHRLTIDQSDPDPTGARVLDVGLTDAAGNPLYGTAVALPENGWWVIGLGPNTNLVPDPVPVPTPEPTPEPTPTPEPEPIILPPAPTPVPVPSTPPAVPGAVATPEPATALLAGIGGLGALGWRAIKRRRK